MFPRRGMTSIPRSTAILLNSFRNSRMRSFKSSKELLHNPRFKKLYYHMINMSTIVYQLINEAFCHLTFKPEFVQNLSWMSPESPHGNPAAAATPVTGSVHRVHRRRRTDRSDPAKYPPAQDGAGQKQAARQILES